jgi:hypothetical protein
MDKNNRRKIVVKYAGEKPPVLPDIKMVARRV